MSEHMKEQTIRTEHVSFEGPPDKTAALREYANKLGLKETTDDDDEILENWMDAFPDLTPENRPGRVLQGLRLREELTQEKLSEKTGIPRRHISEMENAKRPIGKKNAKLLAEALNTGYRVFL